MKHQINRPKVEDVAVAAVLEKVENGDLEWYIYIINQKDTPITNVIVSSKGYGEINGEAIKTSVLRHFVETIDAQSFKKIENIKKEVFGLSNEYMVTFYIGSTIYDKKYIFLPETIKKTNFTTVPILEEKGILIN